MKRFLHILLLGSLFYPSLHAQQSRLDSLETIWNDPKEADSLRFEAGMDLFMMRFRQNLDSARIVGRSMLHFARERNNSKWEATAIRFIGNSYAVQGEFQKALEAFEESHQISIGIQDIKAQAVTLSNLGTIHYELGNYPVALDNLLKGLKLSEQLGDMPGLSRVTNNLGNVYIGQENYGKALEYYSRSLEIKKDLGDSVALANAYNNIGLTYLDLKQPDLALENLLKSAELAEEAENRSAMTRAYSNIGEVYNKQGNYRKAQEYLDESVKIKSEIVDQDGLATALYYRGQNQLDMGRYQAARNDCEHSLELARNIGALTIIRGSCECLSKAWEALGNPQKSLAFFKQAIVAKDSLFSQEKAQEITRYEMQYDFEKKQLADSLAFNQQQAEQELRYEQDLNRQQNILAFVIFGTLALLLFGGLYWRSRQKSKQLAQERTLVDRLKQIDQLKDQFLANTSHELRTPLNGIIGLTESLRDGAAGKLPKEAIPNLDMIANSGKRLTHLVNDLLDFSKLRNRDLQLNLQPVDLHAVADIVLKLCEPMSADKDLELINAIPTDVPLVEADENRIQQILYNLLGNAIKFTESGQVRIDSTVLEDRLQISISDTGIGISEADKDRIFESFEQGDGSIARKYGGTGLGLSVTKQLVALHQGSIEVTSELGKGSVFAFTIPLSRTKRAENAHSKPVEDYVPTLEKESRMVEKVSVEGSFDAYRKCILIVDDEPVNRKVLQNHLSMAGYALVQAVNGREALEVMDSGKKVDLILLDVMMPGMSGYEVCEKIRETRMASELPIVLLTAKNRVSDLVVGFNAGANDYLTKPFAKNELLSRIKTHLNLNYIHKAASRFVPTEFIKSVGRNEITEVRLGDHVEKEVTVVFSDIREYTTLSENMTPRQNFKFVNSYVGKMGPLIQEHQGFVNQFLGDGIMALFPVTAENALRAAIAMQHGIAAYNLRREREGNRPISVGIGMHTGPLVMGIIGDEERNDTAIISDTVNTAARMEGVTKFYGARIILSEDTLDQIDEPGSFALRYLGKVRVKGKEKALGIYECFEGDPEGIAAKKQETLSHFDKGLKHFLANEFSQAVGIFAGILAQNPEDGATRYFLNKSVEYAETGGPKDWEAVTVFNSK